MGLTGQRRLLESDFSFPTIPHFDILKKDRNARAALLNSRKQQLQGTAAPMMSIPGLSNASSLSGATATYPFDRPATGYNMTNVDVENLKVEDNRVAYDPTFNLKSQNPNSFVINPNHETVQTKLNQNQTPESKKADKNDRPKFQSNHSAEISLVQKQEPAPVPRKIPATKEASPKEEEPQKPPEAPRREPPKEEEKMEPKPVQAPPRSMTQAPSVPKIFQDSEFPKTNIKSWLMNPAPRGRLFQCTIVRDRSGIANKIYPKYHIYLSVSQAISSSLIREKGLFMLESERKRGCWVLHAVGEEKRSQSYVPLRHVDVQDGLEEKVRQLLGQSALELHGN